MINFDRHKKSMPYIRETQHIQNKYILSGIVIAFRKNKQTCSYYKKMNFFSIPMDLISVF